MKSELRDLYQEVVIDHSKKPRNFRKPEGANRSAPRGSTRSAATRSPST